MPKTTATVETSSRSPQIPPAITYRLSEQTYLDLGWTAPPLLIQHGRQAVTMKAKFSHPVICPWFKKRNENHIGKYPNGRVLYLAQKNGGGYIYYPNGKLAIKVETCKPHMVTTRVWVYHSGEVERDGFPRPAKFCALFDSLGNGIVYGDDWKKKLVYNQKEGARYDAEERVALLWKWHKINTFESIFPKSEMNGVSKASAMTEPKIENQSKSSDSGSAKGETGMNDSLESAGYINTGKIKPRKVTPLKPIVLNINKYVSLRILDQSDVSLSFFADGRVAKLNIGILYNPFDKLKVTKVEIEPKENDILCPYENFIADTQSLLTFRKLIDKLRKCRKKKNAMLM